MKKTLILAFFMGLVSARAENASYELYLTRFVDNSLFSLENVDMPVDLNASLFKFRDYADQSVTDENWRRIRRIPDYMVKEFIATGEGEYDEYDMYTNYSKQRCKNFDIVFLLKCYDNDEDPMFGMYQLMFITYTKNGEMISKIVFNQERGNSDSNYVSQSYIVGNKLHSRTVGPMNLEALSETPQTVPSVTTVYELNMENGTFEKIGESTSTVSVERQDYVMSDAWGGGGILPDLRIDGVSVQIPRLKVEQGR